MLHFNEHAFNSVQLTRTAPAKHTSHFSICSVFWQLSALVYDEIRNSLNITVLGPKIVAMGTKRNKEQKLYLSTLAILNNKKDNILQLMHQVL